MTEPIFEGEGITADLQNDEPPILCKIELADKTHLEIRDPRVVENLKVLGGGLKNFRSSDRQRESVPVIPVTMWKSDLVRYAIKNSIELPSGKVYEECSLMEPEDIIQIIETLNFLDCEPVANGFAKILASKLRVLFDAEIREEIRPPLENPIDLARYWSWVSRTGG